ncbi:MAG: 3-methyl-2-oxobutanoate hydroxymethyltransferase [Nitrospirae bacterium]|nr:3-methyl-2-oxobutanoate hydroxymethyltransferase [Nitrospirota bacterium]MBI3352313.1 3-methyl-2-oxobutanoate hydroxymethyltransferase [Nitrospirota bacterium]
MTIPDLQKKKNEGKKITMLTAYDFLFGSIVDEAGIDVVLVGDSLSVVVQGNPNTLPVTMDEMVYHTRIVSRGVKNGVLLADMPFLSYQVSNEEAVHNAGRFLKEGGAMGVKLEGGSPMIDRIRAIVDAEIPVMGHLGLTPQSIHKFGGYKVQGKGKKEADKILSDARLIEEAGAFALLLEGIPAELAKKVTKSLSIPTVGIGAGPDCGGQVLVLYDLLGLFDQFVPKFVRKYADFKKLAEDAIRRYKGDVEGGKFPSKEESY